jgi:hypothetical protein
MMASQQYEAAKKDFEYFLRLVDLAINYWATGEQIRQEIGQKKER